MTVDELLVKLGNIDRNKQVFLCFDDYQYNDIDDIVDSSEGCLITLGYGEITNMLKYGSA